MMQADALFAENERIAGQQFLGVLQSFLGHASVSMVKLTESESDLKLHLDSNSRSNRISRLSVTSLNSSADFAGPVETKETLSSPKRSLMT